MNALHLIWIIPASTFLGFLWGAILASGHTLPDDSTQPQGEDYCAVCPFNPREGDDANG